MNSKNNYIRVPYGQSVHGKEEISAVVKVLKKDNSNG